jgi:type IV secretory pathway TrbD component
MSSVFLADNLQNATRYFEEKLPNVLMLKHEGAVASN